jgi:hypothetical protein
MGWIGRLFDRIERRVERPADLGVLDAGRNPGSEEMLESETPTATARRVRRSRDRRRWRWGAH